MTSIDSFRKKMCCHVLQTQGDQEKIGHNFHANILQGKKQPPWINSGMTETCQKKQTFKTLTNFKLHSS